MSSTPSSEVLGTNAEGLAEKYDVTLEQVITEAYRALEWLLLSGVEADGYTVLIVDDKVYLDRRLAQEVCNRFDHQQVVRDKKEMSNA